MRGRLSAVERWQRHRDPHAMHELVAEYSGMVYATCCRILRDRTEAEDVTQDCFVALAQSNSVRPEAVAGWLYAVAVRQCLYRQRSDRRRREREHQYAERPPQTLTRQDAELYRHVDEAVDELPDELRTPLVAHYMEGQSHASIARRLGIPRRTLSHRIERAVKQVGNSLRRRGIHTSGVALALLLDQARAGAITAPDSVLKALAAWAEFAEPGIGGHDAIASTPLLEDPTTPGNATGAPRPVSRKPVGRLTAAACVVSVIGIGIGAAFVAFHQSFHELDVMSASPSQNTTATGSRSPRETMAAPGAGGATAIGASPSTTMPTPSVHAIPPAREIPPHPAMVDTRSYYELRAPTTMRPIPPDTTRRDTARTNNQPPANPAPVTQLAPVSAVPEDLQMFNTPPFFTIDDRRVGETPAVWD